MPSIVCAAIFGLILTGLSMRAAASPFAREEKESAFHILKHGGNASCPLSPAAVSALAAAPLPAAVLAYLTPWNGDGYRRALQLKSRLTHVSPVWYDVKPPVQTEGRTFVTISGDHNVNESWCTSLIAPAPPRDGDAPLLPVKIVPRLQLDGWSNVMLTRLLQEPSVEDARVVRDAFLKAVSTLFKRRRAYFSGLVLEWGHIPLSSAGIRPGVVSLLQALRATLRDALTTAPHNVVEPTLILVVPPDTTAFGPTELRWTTNEAGADFVSVMTYDYSSRTTGRAGPNAPFPWFLSVLGTLEQADAPQSAESEEGLAGRILMGLNHYGYLFRPGHPPDALLGRDVIKMFRAEYAAAKRDAEKDGGGSPKPRPQLTWDADAREHSFPVASAVGQGTAYFPTRAALAHRILRARQARAGLSIWELGQGLDYFAELLPLRRV